MMNTYRYPIVLSIAGLDSGGGAGVKQAMATAIEPLF
jgi:hydroxymethylpyrimidine/phosphomethylpyrimidine kinase